MAKKQLNQIEIVLVKNISTGQTAGEVKAYCYSEDLSAPFMVSMAIDGAEGVIENATTAMKEHMADGGKHEVVDAPPPPPPPVEDDEELAG
tara:strand:- start:226 stop:498 length:273 start_codon:yes stop_codon:yes gene_type:complete